MILRGRGLSVSACVYQFVTLVQFNIQRLAFEESLGVETLEEAKSALRKVIEKGKTHNL